MKIILNRHSSEEKLVLRVYEGAMFVQYDVQEKSSYELSDLISLIEKVNIGVGRMGEVQAINHLNRFIE